MAGGWVAGGWVAGGAGGVTVAKSQRPERLKKVRVNVADHAGHAPDQVERANMVVVLNNALAGIQIGEQFTITKHGIPELQKAVEFAKRYPGRKISIEGHTDNVGNAKYNQGLSERRAAAVKEYLLKNGVSGGERITTVGYGQTKPIADNATANGRFQNRRVELVALP